MSSAGGGVGVFVVEIVQPIFFCVEFKKIVLGLERLGYFRFDRYEKGVPVFMKVVGLNG